MSFPDDELLENNENGRRNVAQGYSWQQAYKDGKLYLIMDIPVATYVAMWILCQPTWCWCWWCLCFEGHIALCLSWLLIPTRIIFLYFEMARVWWFDEQWHTKNLALRYLNLSKTKIPDTVQNNVSCTDQCICMQLVKLGDCLVIIYHTT